MNNQDDVVIVELPSTSPILDLPELCAVIVLSRPGSIPSFAILVYRPPKDPNGQASQKGEHRQNRLLKVCL
eukprot:3942393-Amphidinium_carterae.1